MKKYLLILCLSLIFVFGISYMTTLVKGSAVSEQDIVYATTSSHNKQVQRRLKSLGYYKGKIDGELCSKTRTALRKFQRDNGLKADGILGVKTLAKLNIEKADFENIKDEFKGYFTAD